MRPMRPGKAGGGGGLPCAPPPPPALPVTLRHSCWTADQKQEQGASLSSHSCDRWTPRPGPPHHPGSHAFLGPLQSHGDFLANTQAPSRFRAQGPPVEPLEVLFRNCALRVPSFSTPLDRKSSKEKASITENKKRDLGGLPFSFSASDMILFFKICSLCL